jgi:uncharacterized membrane protein
MRTIAETISLLALAALAFIAINVFHGPHPLPDRIPVHFNAAGQPNGWGSPGALLFLPILAAGLYLLLTVIARFPSLFNYPVKVTDANRSRLEPLGQGLLAWIKAEILLLFVWIEFGWVQAIRGPMRAFGMTPIVVSGAALAVTLIGYFAAMFRAARPTS